MLKKTTQFILSVIPLTRISLKNNQVFSYLADENLPAGTLVSISFFHRKMEGVVLSAKKDFARLGGMELKKIDKVLERSFLTEGQIKLAKFISTYYISPLGVVLKNFVPKRIRSKKQEVRSKNIKSNIKKIKLTVQQEKAVKIIAKLNTKCKISASAAGMQNKKYLLFGPSGSGKTEIYIHSILEIRKKNKNAQFLILVPERTLTPQALERYGQYFAPEEIVLLSSDISKGQFYAAWQKIKLGEAKIIIGTRMAVFGPFQKLSLIIIDEEQDMSYKQWDMNPRYDARTAAQELAQVHNCPWVRGSATPAVETYYRALNKKLKLLELPELEIAGKKTVQFEIVDMKKERWMKNYSCISKKLKSEIEYALKYNQQVILFINRQGMSSFSICDSCKTVMSCPQCDRALLYDEKGNYRCSHCAHETSIFPKCKKCGGLVFKNVGLGTQKVEKEISSLFPAARLARLDSQVAGKVGEQKKIYLDFSTGKIDILIGTQMITKGWDLPRVALVGIIDTDNMLFFPDFTTEEKAFQSLVQVAGRVGRPEAKFFGKVIIQTYQPENKIIKLVSEKDFTQFYAKEIAERNALNFPPHGRIVKLVFQDFKKEKTEAEAQKVFEILDKIGEVKISEPHAPLLPKLRGRFRKQLVIRFSQEKIPEKLRKEIEKLGSGWIVDVDPISLV